MKSITQDIKYYQAILSYADQHGVTKAAIKYRTYRQFIYRLRNRYDGTPESLAPKSRRPHHHPNEHSGEEIALIRRMRKRRPNTGLVRFWVRLRKKGYTRSIAGLYRCMKRLGLKTSKPKKPVYQPKPYQQATFPGEKVQIDVKVVPAACIVGQAKEQGEKMYQYTAIDNAHAFALLRHLRSSRRIRPCSSCSSSSAVSRSRYIKYRRITVRSLPSVSKRRMKKI